MVSNNNVTWTTYTVQGANVNNSYSGNPDTVKINISSVAGNQPTVYIKIGWNARVYCWMIDDMKITEAEANDLTMKSHYFETLGLPYYKTPYWYLAISFFAIITLFVAPNSLLWYISAYVLLRGIIIPAKKSKGLEIFQTSLFIMLFLPLVGFFMDAGRTIGFLRGVFRYHSWPKK